MDDADARLHRRRYPGFDRHRFGGRSLSAIWTLYHFITRNTISGGVMGPDQNITREEALRAATLGNAYLSFEENIRVRSKWASWPICSFWRRFPDLPGKDIETIQVAMTIVGGRIVSESR